MQIALVYTLPHPWLSPNVKKHWTIKWKIGKARCDDIQLDTIRQVRVARLEDNLKWKHVVATIKWEYTNKRPDYDNAIAHLKSTFDGIEKSGLILNDKYLKPMPPDFVEVKGKPMLYITIIELEEKDNGKSNT